MALNVASLPITVGVGAFVIRDGAVLVVRRTYGPSKGLWTIPSGYLEPGESVAQAVEREVREETAVTARAEAIVGVRNRVTEAANDTFLIFAMAYESGEPRPDGEEVSDAAFLPLEDVSHSGDSAPFTRAIVPRLVQTRGMRLDAYAPSQDASVTLAYLLYI
ncbi:MAG TPA: NUDIX domain-containing protein [Thermoplasmata archaeon]|nr:NUDIX domain-containing protein [Thermoplasmata archaeon]